MLNTMVENENKSSVFDLFPKIMVADGLLVYCILGLCLINIFVKILFLLSIIKSNMMRLLAILQVTVEKL